LPHITAGSGYHHLDLVPGALELMLKYGTEESLTGNRPFLLDGLRSYTTWNASG
jgi:hypothetical protein